MQTTFKPTSNKRGFTYQLSEYGEAFIDLAWKSTHPVVDIGCAFGVATLPALEVGANVIAVDISEDHLQTLRDNTPAHYQTRLETLKKRFPNETSFESDSLGAIYISHVLPFLSPAEIRKATQKLYDWLVPGGKIIVISMSPYIKLCKNFLPIYESRKKEGMEWAGLIENLSLYADDKEFVKKLPETLNHMDLDDFRREFSNAGFHIDQLEYFGDPENLLPTALKMDGRERIGMIATKI